MAGRHGPWGESEITAFLQATVIPVRLATLAGDHPAVQSMWFTWDGERIWCATQESALVVRRLHENPRCGFEVAGDSIPYRGVRGTGRTQIIAERGEPVLRALIDRYLGTSNPSLADQLLARADTEVALAITPLTLVTWDFSPRMSDPGDG